MLGFGVTVPLAAPAARRRRPQTKRVPPSCPRSVEAVASSRRSRGTRPSSLNPQIAVGLKDWNACSIFYESLVAFDPSGNLVPVLAQEVPSLKNGGVAKDGPSVTFKLKRGVQWHDGKPFTAGDVVFNWEFAADPATGSPWFGVYKNVKQFEPLDPHTVRCVFTQPTPYWLTTGSSFPGTSSSRTRGPSRGRRQQPQPGRHRAVSVRRLQAGRSPEGRALPRLPRRQPPLLRHP